jgi:hypothetical protein
VSTHERELTEPVDLAAPDGRKLNRDAVGWSRRPLHRANLRGSWGRNKRWDYWAILAGDLVVSSVYADVDYLGLADVWWADLASGQTGGAAINVPLARGIELPEVPAAEPLRVRRSGLDLAITDDADGTTRIVATWREKGGGEGSLDARIALPPGHESLNVVVPWSDDRFQFTSKHQARPVSGTFAVGGEERSFDDVAGGAWGVLDVGRGRWPYSTRWNWGGGAGRAGADGPVVGIQIGGKWTEGTGVTENGYLLDGRLTKLGDELEWHYSWDDPMKPWRVRDPVGRLELELTPRFDKHTKVDALVLRTETHQVFGTWAGHVLDADGAPVRFEGIAGFAEESRSRW